MEYKKPPLEVMPRDIWEEKVKADRIADLERAIIENIKAGRLEPVRKWLDELQELRKCEYPGEKRVILEGEQ